MLAFYWLFCSRDFALCETPAVNYTAAAAVVVVDFLVVIVTEGGGADTPFTEKEDLSKSLKT